MIIILRKAKCDSRIKRLMNNSITTNPPYSEEEKNEIFIYIYIFNEKMKRRNFYLLTLKTHIKDKNKIKNPFPSEILHGTQNLCPQRLVKEEQLDL